MENATPFSTRVSVVAGASETFIVPLFVADSAFRSPNITHVYLEPDAANITLVELGFLETVTGSFLPRWESTSTLGRREYTGMMQTGPRGATVAIRIQTGAAATAKIGVDGMMVDG